MSETNFLYPFIEGDEKDAGALLRDLAASAAAKIRQSEDLCVETLARYREELAVVADAMAQRFVAGGRLFTFGNGGSATDAGVTAALFSAPPLGRPLPARSLTADAAVITALGNDIGFELVFSRQVAAHGRPGDMAMGFSTSGDSDNVVQALVGAHRGGLFAVGLAGYHGGAMAARAEVDHCLVVRSESVHRIQESQAALVHALWSAVESRVGAMELP